MIEPRSRGLLCPLLLLSLFVSQSQGFVFPTRLVQDCQLPVANTKQTPSNNHILLTTVQMSRGGASETALNMLPPSVSGIIESLLFPTLKSGPYGVLAITAVAATAVIPLTLYRQLYSISVGYGLAIFLAGLSLQFAFQPAMFSTGQALTGALMFYGVRLSSYLFLREQTRKTPSPSASRKENSVLQKLTLASSVSLFYGFLSAPAMYALRNAQSMSSSGNAWMVTRLGIGLAIFGAVFEAVADLQKYIAKQSSSSGASSGAPDRFIGPTGLSYRLCRHPNYLGEILFWAGIFVAGVPSFGTSIIAWVASSLGLYGIVAIMANATARLEGQQKEKYGGQEKYDTWTKKVKAPLVPFL